ncbi:MAG: hypothetical protein ACREJQ_06995, partial [bacterium]
MAMGEAMEKVKRPLGIKITALMFLVLGVLHFANGWLGLVGMLGMAFSLIALVSPSYGFPLLACLIAAKGVFLVKPWGRWIALPLTALIVYWYY